MPSWSVASIRKVVGGCHGYQRPNAGTQGFKLRPQVLLYPTQFTLVFQRLSHVQCVYEQNLRSTQSWLEQWDLAAWCTSFGNLCQVLGHLPALEVQTPGQARKWL